MTYTTEQLQSLSAGYRQGFISAEEAVAMLRDAHDERTGELIVGEMFVVEVEHFDWSPLIPRRVIERHFYKSEVSASCHGWRKCESCGDWFNEDSGNFPESVCIDGHDYCCEECAHEDGWERCVRCGTWVSNDYAFTPSEDSDYVYCSDYCAERSGWSRCDRCGEWANDTWCVDTNSGTQRWCEWCYDEHARNCVVCGETYNDDEMRFDDYDDPYCPRCSRRIHLHEYGWTPTLVFFGGNAWDLKPPLFMGIELETDSGYDQLEYAADLDAIIKFADHFWMTEDSSLDNGVEITSHPMTLAHHVSLMPVYEEIAQVASKYRYVSHNSGNCGLHVHVNRRFFGKSGLLQDAGGYKMLRMLQRFEKQFMIFSRRKDDYWCHFYKATGETYVPKDEVCINKKPSRFYDGRENFGELKMAQLMVSNERDHSQALNFQHRNTFEFRIFRGTLKWTTFFASLGLVEGMCWTAKAHGSTWVETVDWYTLINEIVDRVTEQFPKECLVNYLDEKGLR